MLAKRLWLVACWLLISGGTTILLATMLVGIEALQKPTLDIQMHNTYFVLTPSSLIGVLFVPILLVVAMPMALLQRRTVGVHLLLALLSALISGVAGEAAYTLGNVGWTIYPPLSAQPVMPAPPATPYQSFLIGAHVLQFLGAFFFGYNCYQAGKLRAARKLESTGGA